MKHVWVNLWMHNLRLYIFLWVQNLDSTNWFLKNSYGLMFNICFSSWLFVRIKDFYTILKWEKENIV